MGKLAPIQRIGVEDLLARRYPGGLHDVQDRFNELVKECEPHAVKGNQYRDLIDHPGFQSFLQWIISQQQLKSESLKAIDMPTDKRLEAMHQLPVYEEVIQHLIDVIKKGDVADKAIQDSENAVEELKKAGG